MNVNFSNDYSTWVCIAWEAYRDHIPVEEHHDFVAAYSERLNSSDKSVQVSPYTPIIRVQKPWNNLHEILGEPKFEEHNFWKLLASCATKSLIW